MSFQIGPLTIHLYGIIIMLGALAAAWLASSRARKVGINPDIIWDALPWLLVFGIIGARLWHVITPTPTDIAAGRTTIYYFTHPLALIDTNKGGMGIPGAVIFGVAALFVFCRIKKVSFASFADLTAPGLLLAQAIGRWGNFANQELYGAPTDLPWGIYIDPAHRLPGFENFERFHPLFLYESLWNLLNLAVLLLIDKRFKDKLLPGDLFFIYMIQYPVTRFCLDFLRLNNAEIDGINANQAVMAVIAIIAVVILVARHLLQRRKKADEPANISE